MKVTRKRFLTLGVAGAGAVFAGGANGELVETLEEWRQGDFLKAVSRPARYRQVYDITQIGNGVFLNNIKNSLNGFQFGFGFAPREFNIIAALHGNANLLNFDDAMWEKYKLGEYAAVTDPKNHAPATRNIFYPSAANPADADADSEQSIYSIAALKITGRAAGRLLSPNSNLCVAHQPHPPHPTPVHNLYLSINRSCRRLRCMFGRQDLF